MSGLQLCMRLEQRLEHRLDLRQEIKLELKHPEFQDALSGTNENLSYIARYMKKEGLVGVLWGGCATTKILKRKDIDIILLEGEVSPFEEGIDWWNPVNKGYQNGFGVLLPYHFNLLDRLPTGLSIIPSLATKIYGKAACRTLKNVNYPSISWKVNYFPQLHYGKERIKVLPVSNSRDIVAMEHHTIHYNPQTECLSLKDIIVPGLNLVETDLQKRFDYEKTETKKWVVLDENP